MKRLRREAKKIRAAADMVESCVLPEPLADAHTAALTALERLSEALRRELGDAPSAAQRRSNL